MPVPLVRGGSVERTWLNLCEEFAARGHTVTLISRRFSGSPDHETVNGVNYIRLPSLGSPKSKILYRLVDIIFSALVCRSLPPSDITITNSVSLPLLLAKSRAGKIYMSLARFPKGQMGLYRRVDRVQPVSEHVADAVRSQSPSVAALVKVIPNAISETFARGIARHRAPRRKRIIYVGRLAREKGIHLLIRGFAAIQAKHPEWSLLVVGPHLASQGGDGEGFRAELQRESDRSRAAVTFAGPIFDEAELRTMLCESEIFVYPSVAAKGEALPLAPVEAMACGCAVVVSSLGCFADYVSDRANALVFDETDKSGAALAERLDELIVSAPLRERLGRSALTTASRYSRNAIATEFLRDFESVVTRSSGALDV